MTIFDSMPPDLSAKNAEVESIIRDTATKHAALDTVVDGLAGLSPIPGTQLVVLGGQLLTQMKLLYPPMIQKIADVYGAEPDAYSRQVATVGTAAEGIANAVAIASEDFETELRHQLAANFGPDFLSSLVKEALGENAGGLALSVIPWLGAPIGAGVAGVLAWTLTWRVGLTVSVWFQNGGRFLDGSRASTVAVIKDRYVHGRRPTSMTGVVDRIRQDMPEVRRRMKSHVAAEVAAGRAEGRTDVEMRAEFESKGYPTDIVDEVLGEQPGPDAV